MRIFSTLRYPAIVAFLALSFCVLAPGPASAYSRHFTLVNESAHSINELYIAPKSSGDWGEDWNDCVIGFCFNLGANKSDEVHLRDDVSTGICVFDIKAVYDDAHVEIKRDLNLCSPTSVTLSY